MERIPNEILDLIASYLDIKDCFNLALLNKNFTSRLSFFLKIYKKIATNDIYLHKHLLKTIYARYPNFCHQWTETDTPQLPHLKVLQFTSFNAFCEFQIDCNPNMKMMGVYQLFMADFELREEECKALEIAVLHEQMEVVKGEGKDGINVYEKAIELRFNELALLLSTRALE